ncbi:MAG: 16S rRNA (guanine(966)-N(2))-methyltransferase RsmD [Alphaproteobacteria bacterium]
MRVIGGRHRGRRIAAPPGPAVRPTADRVREALFNILVHGGLVPGGLDGARVLDLFAGSGALGLEALSRGAAHVTFVERESAAIGAITRNLAAFGEMSRATVLARDATRPGGRVGLPVTLAFVDPPYGQGLALQALARLAAGAWLAAGALVVVETAVREAFVPPPGFVEVDRRRYGTTVLVFLRAA